jgi:hypothetical protein
VILKIKYKPKKNVIIDRTFNLSVEMNGIGIVSAKYKEINELFTKKRVLNFFIIC